MNTPTATTAMTTSSVIEVNGVNMTIDEVEKLQERLEGWKESTLRIKIVYVDSQAFERDVT